MKTKNKFVLHSAADKMKTKIMWLALIIGMSACTDEEDNMTPTLTITDIQRHSAVITGTIPVEKSLEIDECGIYWSKTNPNMDHEIIADCKDGTFQINLEDLPGGTDIFVSSYVKKGNTFKQGETLQFTTAKGAPELQLRQFIGTRFEIMIKDLGGGEIIEWGFCWTENPNITPNIENSDRVKSPGATYNAPGEVYHTYYTCGYLKTTEGIGYTNKMQYTVTLR